MADKHDDTSKREEQAGKVGKRRTKSESPFVCSCSLGDNRDDQRDSQCMVHGRRVMYLPA